MPYGKRFRLGSSYLTRVTVGEDMSTGPYPSDALSRLQEEERGILRVIDELCRKHGLTYFIDAGTTLGAVRHGGFIPWDDDADVGMPYDDFNRFCELAKTELPEGYSFHDWSNTPGYCSFWPKVYRDGTRFVDELALQSGVDQCIFVDIFPYRVLDENPMVAESQRREATRWERMMYLHYLENPKVPKGPLHDVFALGCKIAHKTVAQLWTPSMMKRYFDRALDTSRPGDEWVDACYATRVKYKTDILFPVRDIQFDGLTLMAPHDCDAYLTNLYGDYMQLPPEDERYTHLPVVLDFGDGVNVMER